MAMPLGTGLSRPTRVGPTIDRTGWFAPAEIADPEVRDKSLLEHSLTVNVVEYVQEAEYFRAVKTMPGQLGAADYLLRLRFNRYRQRRAPHPAYFPGAILTLTLWIWAGGPIYRDTSDLAAELVVTDGRGSVLTTVISAMTEAHSVSLWSPEYSLPSGIAARTALIKDLMNKAVRDLARSERAQTQFPFTSTREVCDDGLAEWHSAGPDDRCGDRVLRLCGVPRWAASACGAMAADSGGRQEDDQRSAQWRGDR